jgi:hypothetical protein
MRRRILWAPAWSVLVLLWTAPLTVAAEAAKPVTVTLAAAPGGSQLDELQIGIVGSDTSGQALGYLRASDAVGAVRLFAEPITDATSKTVVAGADVAFLHNGQVQGDDGFALPDGEKNVVITATATGIARDGRFTSRILAAMADDVIPLGSLTIERSPSSALRIVGASDGAVSRETDTPTFRQSFPLESTTSRKVEAASITFTLFDPTKKQLETTVELDDGTAAAGGVLLGPIEGHASRNVVLAAELDETGTYTGAITLVYDGQREETALTIERTHEAPTVTADDIANAAVDNWWWFADPTLNAMLRETGGHTVTLDAPQVSLHRVENEVHSQAAYGSITVKETDGGTGWTLQPDQQLPIQIAVNCLQGAGAFAGELLLTRPGAGTVKASFTIYQRLAVLWAALAFAIGVGISWLVRRRLRDGTLRRRSKRDILRVQQRIHDLEEELGLSDQERNVALAVTRQLETLADDVERERVTDASTTLAEIVGRVDLLRPYVLLRMRIEALKPADIIDSVRDALREVGDQLTVAGGAEDAKTKLEAIPAAVQGVLKERVRDSTRRLKQDIADVGDVLAKPVAARLGGELDALIADDASSVEALGMRLRRIRDDFLAHLIDDFIARLTDSVAAAPAWYRDPAWSESHRSAATAVTAVKRIEDPEARLAAFRKEVGRHLEELGARLRDAAEAGKRAGGTGAATYEAVRAKAGAALEAVRMDDLASAQRALNEAISLYPSPPAGPGRLGQAGAPGADVAVRMSLGLTPDLRLGVVDAGLEPVALPDPRRRLRALDRELHDRARLLEAIAVGAGVLVGLFTLYLTNPTWGSLNDIVVAILWGLGLHQVSGAALSAATVRSTLLGERDPDGATA